MPTLTEESTDTLLLSLPELLEESGPPPVRYCFNTSTIRGQRLRLDEIVEIAAAAGYDAIEPWIEEIERFEAEGGDLGDLRSRLVDLGLTVEGAIGFFEWIVDDEARRTAGLARARQDMRLLARLGGKRIAAPPFGAHEVGAARIDLLAAAPRFADLCAVGDETGVEPLLEVWGFSANVSRLGEGVLIAAESGRDDALLLLDSYHLYKGGSPLSGLKLLAGDRLPVFHINDYPALPRETITDADRVYPGDGVAPLLSLIRTLHQIGFRGHLSLELFNANYWAQDPALVARTGLAKLKDLVTLALG